MKKIFKSSGFWTFIVIATLVTLQLLAVHLGRIYYPKNFRPDEVSFFENLWVLMLFEFACVVGAGIVISIIVRVWLFFYYIIDDLIHDLRG